MSTPPPQWNCHDDCSLQAIAEAAVHLRRTGHEVVLSGSIIALTSGALALWVAMTHNRAAAVVAALITLAGAARGVALLLLAHKPLLASIGGIRQAFASTGNPTWLPTASFSPPGEDRQLTLVRAFISAAYTRQRLSRQALRWASGTMTCFVLLVLAISLS
jgi:hypothetical protein